MGAQSTWDFLGVVGRRFAFLVENYGMAGPEGGVSSSLVRYVTSPVLGHWDEDEQAEEATLAELADLLKRITALDPAAYGTVGDHETHYWPAVLDRWLY